MTSYPVFHVVQSDKVWSLKFNHCKSLLTQRRKNSTVTTKEQNVKFTDAKKKCRHCQILLIFPEQWLGTTGFGNVTSFPIV